MYAMAALLAIALIANKLVGPIHEKHHMETQVASGSEAPSKA
jgi:hypothetical protein